MTYDHNSQQCLQYSYRETRRNHEKLRSYHYVLCRWCRDRGGLMQASGRRWRLESTTAHESNTEALHLYSVRHLNELAIVRSRSINTVRDLGVEVRELKPIRFEKRCISQLQCREHRWQHHRAVRLQKYRLRQWKMEGKYRDGSQGLHARAIAGCAGEMHRCAP